MSLLVIGSYNQDQVLRVAHLPAPGETATARDSARYHGGKGSNQAVQAARCGARVTLAAALGRDVAGRGARALWRAEGILARIQATSAASGSAVILVDDHGENCIVVEPGANALLTPAHAEAAVRTARPRVVLAQLETPVAATAAGFAAARRLGASTVLNAAPVAGPLPEALAGLVDLLVVNAGEAAQLGGDPGRLATRHRLGVLVTLGAEGAMHVAADGAVARWPARPVVVRDTTGAGDAFVGCLAAHLAMGHDWDSAVRHAMAAGALACTRDGAVPALHGAAEIAALAGAPTPG